MRPRDVRAIAFWIVSTLLLVAVTGLLLRSYVISLALAAAYNAWLLTRPRMIRVFRRLRGEPDWSGYYQNKTPGPWPERDATHPRPGARS